MHLVYTLNEPCQMGVRKKKKRQINLKYQISKVNPPFSNLFYELQYVNIYGRKNKKSKPYDKYPNPNTTAL